MVETANDFSTYPLKFEQPIPDIIRRDLPHEELSKLICVTTVSDLQKWFQFRSMGAGLKGGRSFAAQFLREESKKADVLLSNFPGCYVTVFLDATEDQPGRVIARMLKMGDDGRLSFTGSGYFDFSYFAAHGSPDSWQYLIYAEYVRQLDLEQTSECCPTCKGRGRIIH